MSNTELQKAYGTIIDSYKDTFQRDWVANKLLESANFSIKRAKNTLDDKQAEWIVEYENCEHTGQVTDKLGKLERTVQQYIPQNLENLEENRQAIEKAMASLGINQTVTKTIDTMIDPRMLSDISPENKGGKPSPLNPKKVVV